MSTISDSQDNMFDSSDLTSCGDNESSPNTVATDVTTKSKSHHSPHQRGRLFPSRCIVSPFGGQAEEGLPLNRSAKFTSPYTPVPGAEANYNDSAPWHASLQNQIDWDSYASMQLSQYNMSEEPHSVNLSLGCYETTESQPSPDKHDEISVTKATILDLAPALYGARFKDGDTCTYSVVTTRRARQDPATAVLIAYVDKDHGQGVKVAGGTTYCFHLVGAMRALLAEMQTCVDPQLPDEEVQE